MAGNETTNMVQVCNESSRDMLRAPIQKYSFNWIILWLYLTVEIQLNNMGEKLEWGEKEKETFQIVNVAMGHCTPRGAVQRAREVAT